MIGVTSGADNCAAALTMGYDAAIDRKSEDIAARVRELTGGKGVEVAYDSAGKATFDATIGSLATFGMFVSFGATTGSCPDVSPNLLQHSGSLYFTRPTLANYAARRAAPIWARCRLNMCSWGIAKLLRPESKSPSRRQGHATISCV